MGTTRLVLAALALTGAMLALVPFLTAVWPGGVAGYFTALGLYWAFFCVPVIAVSLPRQAIASLFSLRLRGAVWVPVVLLAQVAVFAIYAVIEGFLALPVTAILLGTLFALINAPLEELAWRAAYHRAAPANALVQGLGVWLFALWHIPLMLASGVEFSLSPALIVLSSFTLGGLWAMATFQSGAVGWPTLAHVLNNIIALPALIAHNT